MHVYMYVCMYACMYVCIPLFRVDQINSTTMTNKVQGLVYSKFW